MSHAPQLVDLFRCHRYLREVIDAVLEGVVGQVVTDDVDNPRAARLDVGCYAFFAGTSESEAAAALVSTVRSPRELLFPDDSGWRALVHDAFAERLVPRPAMTFHADDIDVAAVEAIAARRPEGIRIAPADLDAARMLDESLAPHALQVFPSPEAFVAAGRGFVAWEGDTLASAATSYTVCSHGVEVAISTRPAYRQRGLAKIVAAALIADCLRDDLRPAWSASNPISQKLALSLGYREAGECEILKLDAARPGRRR